MSVRTCDHLKEDGFYCKSPALRGRDYCYFHLKLRGRRLNMARARALAADHPLDLPFPEDMHSVQVTLFEVVNPSPTNASTIRPPDSCSTPCSRRRSI